MLIVNANWLIIFTFKNWKFKVERLNDLTRAATKAGFWAKIPSITSYLTLPHPRLNLTTLELRWSHKQDPEVPCMPI